MYTQDFYITDPVGNNAFSYEKRSNKKLFVPSLKKIESFEEIELLYNPSLSILSQTIPPIPTFPPMGERSELQSKQVREKITFEDFDFDGKLQTCYGLKNLYELSISTQHLTPTQSFSTQYLSPTQSFSTQYLSPTLSCQEREQTQKDIPVYIMDNHNHAYYFWYLARSQGIISDGALLYHIDEHADMRDPGEYLMKPESQDLQKVFEYTNFFVNVGNFIVPAMKDGLIGEVKQIRSADALREYLEEISSKITSSQFFSLGGEDEIARYLENVAPFSSKGERIQDGGGVEGEKNQDFGYGDGKQSIILNLDLDFFQPELDYIDFELKKQAILDIAAKADLITICTSPFFIEQERALRVLREIFT